MRHLTYLLVLAGCLGCAVWLEPVLRVNVFRRLRRLVLTVAPVLVVFVLWDLAAIAAGHWRFDPAQTTGVVFPGDLPLDEVLFFAVVPVCAILGFEAVRAVLGTLPRPAQGTPPVQGSPPGQGSAPVQGFPPGQGSAPVQCFPPVQGSAPGRGSAPEPGPGRGVAYPAGDE